RSAETDACAAPADDSARTVHDPGAAKNRNDPVADVTTSAVNSPVESSSRTNAPGTGWPACSTTPWMTVSLATSIPSSDRPPTVDPHIVYTSFSTGTPPR